VATTLRSRPIAKQRFPFLTAQSLPDWLGVTFHRKLPGTTFLRAKPVDASQNPARTPSDIQVQREFAQRASNPVIQHSALLLQAGFTQYLSISL
jgi:hypothetical protein